MVNVRFRKAINLVMPEPIAINLPNNQGSFKYNLGKLRRRKLKSNGLILILALL